MRGVRGSSTLVLLLGALMLCCLLQAPVAVAKKIPKWWMKVAQKQGPNACVVEEVPGTGKEFWTECRYWLNRKICGRKTIVRFECCEGFEQIEGESGCTRVKPLINLLETAESLGATRWAAYIRESGLAHELETAGAYTLFAPTNQAFDEAKASLRSQLESYRGNPSNPVLLYHIVPTKLPSDHFEANTVVETRHSGNFLRINKYSNGMNTINCALLLQKDQQATNGIVHIIDSMLDPSKSLSENVADMVLKDGRFTVLSEMLEKSGYINVLRTLHGSVTFLAPSDEAFQKLPDSRREKIINDREARLALIQNHIIPHVICESAITGEHRVRTVSSNKLTFNCDIEGAYVETSKLRGNFNLGKNGIIHILDDVLLPDRAKNLIELAESRQLFTFAELVRTAGLEETLSHTGDYTFFVPDENAWFELDPSVLRRARSDVEYAGLLIRFHGAYGRHLTNAITDNQAIMSLDEENPVRLQVWRRAMGVEDARITTPDVEAQNGVIHIINKVIFPSNQTALATLRSLPGRRSFNTYSDLLQRASSQQPPVVSLGPGDETFYTFFAPTDEAFGSMDATTLQALRRGDEEVVSTFVKKYIAVNMFPFTSFESNLIYSIESMDGSNFNLKKDGEGKLTVNGVSVVGSHMSANGVIHLIDEVIMPSSSSRYGGSHSSSSSSSSHRYGGGQSGGQSYSSSSYSSSSSSGGSSRSSTSSVRKTITFAEGHEDAENRHPSWPQGSGQASNSVLGRAEVVSSSPAIPASHSQPASSGAHKPASVSSNLNLTSYPEIFPTGESVVETNRDPNTARMHDNSDQYSHSHSTFTHSSQVPNEPRTDYPTRNREHDYHTTSSYNTHEHEPGLAEWRQTKRKEVQTESRRQGHHLHENNEIDGENELSLNYGDEYQIQEERRRLELARQNEILRRANRQKELRMLHQNEISVEERRNDLVRQRQEELRQQQEENARIEEENRLRELAGERLNVIESETSQGTVHNGGVEERTHYHISTSHSSHGDRNGQPKPGLATNLLENPSNTYDQSPTNYARNNTFDSSSSRSYEHQSNHNTIGPVTPNGTRYSYVGRSFGDDIVGHPQSGPDPYTNRQYSSSVRETSRHVPGSNTRLEGGIVTDGFLTTTTRRRMNVTRTVVSYPSSKTSRAQVNQYIHSRNNGNVNGGGSSYSSNYPRQYSNSNGAGDKSSSGFVSAYAFTGGETEYADGQEFVESGAPVVATITVNQARALRRQMRRKRHHQRLQNKAITHDDSTDRKNRKGRKRMRNRRARNMHKALRQRQALRRIRKHRKTE